MAHLRNKMLLLAALIITIVSSVRTSPAAADLPSPKQNKDSEHVSSTYLLQAVKADLTGDSIPDAITLSGTNQSPSSGYYDKLNIRVLISSETRPMDIALPGGYNPSIQLLDVNGDRINDICVYVSPDSQGGSPSIVLYTIQDQQPVALPLPPPLALKGVLKDHYKVPVMIQNTNETYMLELSERKSLYEAMGYYQNGRLLQPASIISSGFHKLEPVDRDTDGIWEMKGIQHIAMLSNDNTIAIAESLWKWRYGHWTLVYAKIISAS
ncbi:hypothetical protein [Paenibacillus sp. OAS669]|uniref:hypothetical protein n=1 Tax=Paenibacillus sp. OAS669 TaxID=2663821 RepID=UPI0017899E63|nr:hypothetical protein [Paenibacillus sp. OAS669]MBE1441410.1 hypothetical protein [Paenibacillus sp. OAS669]